MLDCQDTLPPNRPAGCILDSTCFAACEAGSPVDVEAVPAASQPEKSVHGEMKTEIIHSNGPRPANK